MKKRLLLVEDDKSLGFVIRENLERNGYEVELAVDGESGLDAARRGGFDLLILDVMLPRIDGFTLAQQIREVDAMIPILFLSAKSLLEDRLEGLRKGGDDYLTKPFSMEELLLKIEVFLKRIPGTPGKGTFSLGKYTFDPANLSLQLGEKVHKLTQKESLLLEMLVENKGLVMKREDILSRIWGKDDYFLGRSMDVFISKLRKYLRGDPSISIVNYHGVGFRLEIEE